MTRSFPSLEDTNEKNQKSLPDDNILRQMMSYLHNYSRFVKTQKRRVRVSFLPLFLALVLCVCAVSAADNQTVSCGVILPLSGDNNQSGTALLNGIELAADELNARGGVEGHIIDLHVIDDTGDPDTAVFHFKKMQEEKIPVVIGSFSTDLTLPMAEELQGHDTILISPTANGEILYGISPQFYQIYGPVFYVARSISDWLSYTADRVAFIYVDDTYGRSLSGAIQSTLSDSVTISGTEPIGIKDSDFSALTHRILDHAPDSIVVILYDSRLIPILENLTDNGFRGKVVLADSSVIDTLEKEASEILPKFFIFTISANSNLVSGIHTQQFTADYQARFGEDPTRTLAGYGYDSMMVVAEGIRLGLENGSISSSSIQNGLHSTRYFGVTGPKVFDADNSVSPALDRWVFNDGKFRLISTSLP